MAKIAIIEDEPSIVEMYRFKLEQSGHEVQFAFNGQSGYDLIATFKPDIALIDLMMPELSGDQLLQKVRSTDWGKSLKVIILTNISETDAPPGLEQLGIDRYVVKAQNTPSDIAVMVDELLNAPKAA